MLPPLPIVLGNKGLDDIPRNANYEMMRSASGRMDAVAAQTLVIGENGTAAPAGSLDRRVLCVPARPRRLAGRSRPEAAHASDGIHQRHRPASTFGLYRVTASAAVTVTLGAVVAPV